MVYYRKKEMILVQYTIREMAPEDADEKGYVHWKSWQETYPGLVDAAYLSRLTLEKCRQTARRWPENTLVAQLDGRIVGFSCYCPCQSGDMPGCGEVSAIYVLKEAQGLGIGRALMDAAMARLSGCAAVMLWVLQGNDRAISFYEHYGFRFDGVCAPITLGTPNTELRMVYHRI